MKIVHISFIVFLVSIFQKVRSITYAPSKINLVAELEKIVEKNKEQLLDEVETIRHLFLDNVNKATFKQIKKIFKNKFKNCHKINDEELEKLRPSFNDIVSGCHHEQFEDRAEDFDMKLHSLTSEIEAATEDLLSKASKICVGERAVVYSLCSENQLSVVEFTFKPLSDKLPELKMYAISSDVTEAAERFMKACLTPQGIEDREWSEEETALLYKVCS